MLLLSVVLLLHVTFTFLHLRIRVLGYVCMGVHMCMLDFKLA